MTQLQITPHFKDYEFMSRDGVLVPMEYRWNMIIVARQLEKIRSQLAEPVYINSGYRSNQHNKNVGGASRSYHLYAMAVDIRCSAAKPKDVYKVILSLMDSGDIVAGGLKMYDTFVHYDIRGVKTLF